MTDTDTAAIKVLACSEGAAFPHLVRPVWARQLAEPASQVWLRFLALSCGRYPQRPFEASHGIVKSMPEALPVSEGLIAHPTAEVELAQRKRRIGDPLPTRLFLGKECRNVGAGANFQLWIFEKGARDISKPWGIKLIFNISYCSKLEPRKSSSSAGRWGN